MAEHLAGTQENFVAQMNAKAAELGMTNTHFMNAHGIDEDNHYTTAMDIAIMSKTLIVKHPDILKYTSIWMDSLRNGEFGLSSTNKLIRFYEGANGIKTGSTSKALYNLSGSATRNGTTFIAVVCTAPSSDIRNEEVKQLLDYGFANFSIQSICAKNTIVDNISVNKNLKGPYEVVIPEDVNILCEKGKEIEYDKQIVYNTNLVAPIINNTSIGKVTIINKSDGSIIAEKDVIINKDITKANLKEYYKFLIKKILTLG